MHDIRLLNFKPISRNESIVSKSELSAAKRNFTVNRILTIERLMQVITIKMYNNLWNKYRLSNDEFVALSYHVANLVETELIDEQNSMEDITSYSDTELLVSLNILGVDVKNRSISVDVQVADQQTAFDINFNRNE